MGENSKISWTDHTFNPWWGCVNVSPACDNCYAESFSKRVGQQLWGADAPRRFFGDKHWNEPLKWNRDALKTFGRPARVFCASMADVFEDRPELSPHRERLRQLISVTPNLLHNLLTKRYSEIKKYIDWLEMPNVRIGVTVENQTYDFRIVPGVSWISYEPALGPLDLREFIGHAHYRGNIPGLCVNIDGESLHPDTPGYKCRDCGWGYPNDPDYPGRVSGPKWVIIGGESGHSAREMKLEWALSMIQQCKAIGVAVHFKQTGDVLARKLGLKDRSGKDASEWPKELQIQEFPVTK